MATIADISKKTGYSESTVASVLRGAPNFREQTKQKVLEVAAQFNYQPNWLGRALAGAGSMTIGIFGSRTDVSSSMQKIGSIEEVVREAGYLTYFVSSPIGDVDVQKQYLHNLLARRIDGLIVNCLPMVPDEEILGVLDECDIPVVYMDMVPSKKKNCIVVDRVTAIVDVLNHLDDLGHSEIALITDEFQSESNDLKIAAYRQAAKAHGMTLLPIEDWVYRGKASSMEELSYAVVAGKIKEAKDGRSLPTALVTLDDNVAIAAIRALNDGGLSVPDDVSVIGFDDLGMASIARPRLTTIHQPRGEVGYAAASMLLELINNAEGVDEPTVFSAKLVVRESTGVSPKRS